VSSTYLLSRVDCGSNSFQLFCLCGLRISRIFVSVAPPDERGDGTSFSLLDSLLIFEHDIVLYEIRIAREAFGLQSDATVQVAWQT